MDNDGVSDEYIDVEEIYQEIKKKIETRMGGPWVINPNDNSSFLAPNSYNKPAHQYLLL